MELQKHINEPHCSFYFDSIPRTPSCCWKRSAEQRTCDNLQLKIIPANVCCSSNRTGLLHKLDFLLKLKLCTCEVFLKDSVRADVHRQEVIERQTDTSMVLLTKRSSRRDRDVCCICFHKHLILLRRAVTGKRCI